MKRIFSLTRALVARKRKIFALFFALAASVGLMNAKVTWNSSNINGLYVWGTDAYSMEGVTLSTNGDMVEAAWDDGYGDESTAGISFRIFETGGGFTFSNTLGKNFTKIEMSLVRSEGWDLVNLGSGWSFWESFGEGEPVFFVTWKGNASTVDLLKDESDFHGQNVKSIVFYFEGDSEEPDPTYTVALMDGTVNADKVTLSKTSAVEGATVTVTPNEEYEITAFKATYNTTEELSTSFNAETDAYSFKMPAANVTIEATIALKPVPEGDVFAGFSATAGSGGFDNEGHANLVDNKFISSDWTKWCANDGHKSVPTGESESCWWIDFEASAALNLTGYILTTGNDTGNEHGRNPKNWVLKAKLNADDAWTTIATVTNDVTMKNQSFKDYKFFVDQSGSYKYFRFEVFANQGANVMQLCQLRLIGTEAAAPATVAVTGVTLDQNEAQMTVGGVTLTLTATVAPDDATDKTVVWTSSDPSVATVANGVVIAVAAGSATITATATNGTPDDTTDDFSATCDVTVSDSSDEGSGSTGALPGKFSVSASQVVYFSRGNLQASTTDLGANWTWAFAKNQYNCVAANASNTAISGNGTVSTNGTVDLFGWSTAATQYGIHVKPFNSTYSGDFVDWGSNPDLIAALGTGWRTLTSDEWTYLLDTRTTTSGVRYAKAEITDKTYRGTPTTIKGLIILPDDWSTDYHALASTNTADAAFTSNQITSTVWKNELEAHGAVFMPAAGYRLATSIYSYGDRGYYWSATPNGADNAYELIFIGDNVYLANNGRRFDGHSVRLVSETAPTSGTCGDDLTWEFNTETGALTISGTGAMNDYSWDPNAAPWYAYKDAITSVSFPEGITTIGAYAFVNCDNAAFTTVTIPEGVIALGVNAFYNCDGIQEITIPSTVTTFGVGAIYDCKAVNSITSYIASPTNLHGFAIYGYKNTCTLYVPYGSIDAYKAADCWKSIPNIAAIPGTLTPEGVIEKINAIGTVELTAECKAKIDAARAAYDALSDGDKTQVTNSATLTTAETDYAALAAAAAAPVIAQIEALPTAVKLSTYFSTYDLMVAARAAYNALSAEVQAAVTNLSKLTNLEAAFAAIGGVNEKLSKPFSVGAGQVVYFSHGNLQATYNGTNWSWAFAAHQYDYIGDTSGNIIINGNGTLSGAGTVDLFGWVANSSTVLTSGVAKYGVSNSDNVGDYGLGTTETLKGDWGVAANDANIGGYNDWRILSNDEWVYLFKTRTDAASKYGYATVGGVNGVIIIPDAFTDPMKNKGNLAFRPQNVDKGYSTNVYTTGGNWEAMEAAGAVFMPAAGRRYGTTMTVNEGTGFYWSSTPMSYQASYFMGFMGSNVVPDNDRYRSHGLSVRLVSNNAPVASTPLDSARVVKDLIEAIPAEITLEDACVKAINDAREAYNKLSEAAKGLLDEATIAKLTDAEAALTALYQAEADKVVAKINEIPSPMTAENTKLSVYQKVQDARAAYDALTAEQKLLVQTAELQKLTDAEAAFAAIGGGDAGALKGKFSVADGKVVYFSKGNLQLIAANTWKFADNQWDYFGTEQSDNHRDLFGWGAINETQNTNHAAYTWNEWGENTDLVASLGTGWRTLTKDEWNELLFTRSGATVNGTTDARFAKATINTDGTAVTGVILFPDDYDGSTPAGVTWGDINATYDNYSTSCTEAGWDALEALNCVFLPVTGDRWGTTVSYVGERCAYWSSTASDENNAYNLRIEGTKLPLSDDFRAIGDAVRLVTETASASSPIADAQAAKDLIDAIPQPVVYTPECSAAIKAAREALDALSDEAKTLFNEADTAALPAAEATYAGLLAQKVAPVIAAIDAVPATPLTPENTKLSEYNKVTDARALYDALTDEEKAAVTNYDKLTAVEAAFAAIGGGGGVPTVVVIYKSEFTSTGVTKEGVNLALSNGSMTADDMLAMNGSFKFSTSLGKFTNITIETDVNIMNISESAFTSAGWPTGTNLGTSAAWTGNSESVLIDCMVAGNAITITCTIAPASVIADAIAARDLINAIPDPVTLDEACVKAIKDAREAVTALGENASLIDASDMTKLTDAEAALTALYQAEVDKVVAKINNIPTPVTLKLATRDSIEGARAAYEALNAEQKALVPAAELQKLTDAEAELATLNPGGGAPLPEGALTGAFSINADGSKIAFSKGNLQATYGGSDWTWAFAAHQYDYIGNAVANTAITGSGTVSANGTVDLFGWSTAATYYGINNTNVSGKHPGDFIDWGETIAEGWRTLTRDEWGYLFETRTDAASKYGHATVAGIHGIIVLPDSYKGTAINADHSDWSNNIISAEDWAAYEANGVAFLPAAGSRLATSVSYVGEYAFYWTSTTYGEKWAYRVRFVPDLSPDYGDRVPGQSVRLVTAHPGGATPLDSAQVVKDLIDAIPAEITLDAACVNAVQAARDAYNALTEATKGALDAATVQKLNQAITDYTALIQAGADAVITKINNIPQPVTLKLATRDSIESARAAYDALNADQKLLVSNYDVLTAAEATWAGLIYVAPAGALSGKYTINGGGDVIYFAHGNLQYTRENLDADWSTGTFRLAENQYDLIELIDTYPEAYCTDNYGDKTAVGLFGWGTWGEGKTPNLTSSDRTLYTWSTDFSGTLEGTDTWRTLTKDEWVYLLAHNNQSYATVHGVNGLLVAPDGKDIEGKSMTDWVEINDETWTTMQNDGYLFLPACGQRSQLNSTAKITTGSQGKDVVYYSSTQYSDVYAYNIWYKPGQDPAADDYSNKRQAFGVRLVSAGVNPLDQAQAAKDLIDAIPDPVVLSDECKAKIDAAREAVTALGENASLLDDADIDKLAKAEADFALLIKDATAVVAKIDAIGDVTFSAECKEKIVDARNAYEELADELKPYVTNLGTLTDAEAAYEAARPFAPVTTVPAAVEALQYTGVAQTLITAGTAEHGTILYSLDGVDYSAELPTALLPGTYTVYYKVQATDDYKDVAPATFTATIAYNYPATYSLFGIPEGWSVKVNGTEATVENGAIKNIAKDDKFDVLPTKPEDVKLVEIVPYLLDLATATDSVIYLMNGDSITGTANGNISIVIVPDAKVYFKDVNLTNTGSHPAVLCGGNAEMVVVGENTITCTTEGEYGIRTAGTGTTLTLSGDKTQLSATIDPNGGTVNQ